MAKLVATIRLTSLPPVDVLKKSLMYVAQNRVDEGVRILGLSSTDKIKKYAKVARQLSTKACFFCQAVRTKSKLKDNVWEGYDLCPCVLPLAKGYREHNPWMHRLAQIPSLIARKEMDPQMVAYSDECVVDGVRFYITFGQIARSYTKFKGKYVQAKRCLSCVIEQRKANNATVRTPYIPVPVVNQLVPATEVAPVQTDVTPPPFSPEEQAAYDEAFRRRNQPQQQAPVFTASQQMNRRRGAAPKKRYVKPGKPRGFAQPLSAPIAEQLAAKHKTLPDVPQG